MKNNIIMSNKDLENSFNENSNHNIDKNESSWTVINSYFEFS